MDVHVVTGGRDPAECYHLPSCQVVSKFQTRSMPLGKAQAGGKKACRLCRPGFELGRTHCPLCGRKLDEKLSEHLGRCPKREAIFDSWPPEEGAAAAGGDGEPALAADGGSAAR